MSTQTSGAVFPGTPQTLAADQNRRLRQWSMIATLLIVALFIEAAFAGAMLSGVDWARNAHRVTAAILVASAVIAGLAAIVTLRRIPKGRRLGVSLLSLAALVVIQAVIGAMTAKGANLLWVHVPLGAALLGIATQAAARARSLRAE